MQLNQYIQEKFPNLELSPNLFYNWNKGIRFALGEELDWESQHLYLQECSRRAITLFEALHSPTDDIFIVVDVDDSQTEKYIYRKFRNFSPYVENHFFIKSTIIYCPIRFLKITKMESIKPIDLR